MFRRAKPCFDDAVVAILARLRRSQLVCSDETTVRIDGETACNWVFHDDNRVVIHVIRKSRAAAVVGEVMAGHRPEIWLSDLYSAQRGHADEWQICLAHQLRDCQYATDAGDRVFAPRMKLLLLRAVVYARRRHQLAPATRLAYRQRFDRELDALMGLAPTNKHGKRLRKRYAKVRSHLFTFLQHPEVPPDNNGSERELRPTATYRKVTGGFHSERGADLFAAASTLFRPFSRPYAVRKSSSQVNTPILPSRKGDEQKRSAGAAWAPFPFFDPENLRLRQYWGVLEAPSRHLAKELVMTILRPGRS